MGSSSSSAAGASSGYLLVEMQGRAVQVRKGYTDHAVLKRLCVNSELVDKIKIYSTPLWGTRDHPFYSTGAWHAFVWIQTRSHFWTIEKTKHYTLVQVCGTSVDEVLNARFWPQGRPETRAEKAYLKELRSDKARENVKMDAVLEYTKMKAKESYRIGQRNCKHMAEEIFNKFARSKTAKIT